MKMAGTGLKATGVFHVCCVMLKNVWLKFIVAWKALTKSDENTERAVSLQRPDFSDYKRETIVLYLRAGGLVDRVPRDALIMLVVGMLIADDEGAFSEQALLSAMNDPSAMQVARTLIKKAKDA